MQLARNRMGNQVNKKCNRALLISHVISSELQELYWQLMSERVLKGFLYVLNLFFYLNLFTYFLFVLSYKYFGKVSLEIFKLH